MHRGAVMLRVCYTESGKPKERYTEREAQDKQRHYNQEVPPGERRLSAYKCELCGHWHIGRSRRVLSKGDKKKIAAERRALERHPAHHHHGGY
jgi:hypothetical protein